MWKELQSRNWGSVIASQLVFHLEQTQHGKSQTLNNLERPQFFTFLYKPETTISIQLEGRGY